MPAIRIRVSASLDANVRTVYQPIEQAAERSRARIQKSFDQAAKEPSKVVKAAKSSGDKLIEEVEREGEKIFQEEEKSQRKRTREVEKGAKERARLEREAMREVEQMLEEDNRARDARDRAAKRRGDAADKRRQKAWASAGRQAWHGIGAGFGMANALLRDMGLETSLAPHMANAIELQQRAVDVTNAGYIPGMMGAQGVKQDPAAVEKEVRAAANHGAFATNDVAEGLQKFVGLTGDLETGRQTLQSMAELARATGSDFVSMAEASAEVSNHLGDVPDKAKAIDQVMRIIAGQGKMGALEIRDFARQMAKIAANAPAFEGSVVKNIGELGLIAQETKLRGGAASASQAATSVMAFANDFAKGTTFKHWAKVGLNPYTDKSHTTLRSPEELILETLRYSKGDRTKIAQLFPNVRAGAAVRGFASVYAETAGSEDDKIRAVSAEFERLRNAQLMAVEVQRAYTEALETNKSAIQIANNELDAMAGDLQATLLPAVAELAPALVELAGAAAGVFKYFAHITGLEDKKNEADNKNATMMSLSADQWLASLAKFEATNVTGGTGPRSDIMANVAMDRARPILQSQEAQEKAVADKIAQYKSKLADMRNGTLAGLSEDDIKYVAEEAGPMASNRADAQQYEAAQDALQGLEKTYGKLQDAHSHLLQMLTSGQVTVTVANLPSGGSQSQGGTAPPESDGPSP